MRNRLGKDRSTVWSSCMTQKSSACMKDRMDSASSLKTGRNSTSGMNSSSSQMKLGRNSASWKNNSASLLKIVLDSASLFLDSASQVAKPQTLRVETRICESSGDSVSWTGQDSEIGRLGESWTDSASRVANGRTLTYELGESGGRFGE